MKNQLIKDIIKNLDKYNEYKSNYGEEVFDYIEHLAVLEQQLGDSKYEDFLYDLDCYDYYIINVDEDKEGFYQLPKITILFPDHDRYMYEIGFGYREHHWGYCQCQPTDEDYNVEHKCCGTDCDWYAPLFTISKNSTVGQSIFQGLERDLWSFAEERDKDNKDKKRKELQNEIDELLKTKEAMETKIGNLELKLEIMMKEK